MKLVQSLIPVKFSVSSSGSSVVITGCNSVCEVNVSICVENGDSALITFNGVGFDKRLVGDTMNVGDASHLNGVPSLQRQLLPGQVIQSIPATLFQYLCTETCQNWSDNPLSTQYLTLTALLVYRNKSYLDRYR